MVFHASLFPSRFCQDPSAPEQWWPGINVTQKLELEKREDGEEMEGLGWRLVLGAAVGGQAAAAPSCCCGAGGTPSPPAHLGEEQELETGNQSSALTEELCQLKLTS